MSKRLVLDRPYCFTQLTGFGLPQPEHRTTRSPFQDGETWVRMSYASREVTLTTTLLGCSFADLVALRQNLYSFINPSAGLLWLDICYPDGSYYTLRNVAYTGGAEGEISTTVGPRSQTIALKFSVYDPIWYKSTTYTIFSAARGQHIRFDEWIDDGFGNPVPPYEELSFPIIFEASDTILETKSLSVGGNYPAWPIATFRGPLSYPRLPYQCSKGKPSKTISKGL